jgi:hypothetical protein
VCAALRRLFGPARCRPSLRERDSNPRSPAYEAGAVPAWPSRSSPSGARTRFSALKGRRPTHRSMGPGAWAAPARLGSPGMAAAATGDCDGAPCRARTGSLLIESQVS